MLLDCPEFRTNKELQDEKLVNYYVGQAEIGLKEIEKFAGMKSSQRVWNYTA